MDFVPWEEENGRWDWRLGMASILKFGIPADGGIQFVK